MEDRGTTEATLVRKDAAPGISRAGREGAAARSFAIASFGNSAGLDCERESRMFQSAMALPYPTHIPGLRSPSEQVGGLVHFGRMLDKIRLAAAGKLPEAWQPMRGQPLK